MGIFRWFTTFRSRLTMILLVLSIFDYQSAEAQKTADWLSWRNQHTQFVIIRQRPESFKYGIQFPAGTGIQSICRIQNFGIIFSRTHD